MSLAHGSIPADMASKKRNFLAYVPVSITVRFSLRLPFLLQQQLQQMMLTLMTYYAEKCGVKILWYDLRPNHLHITALQAFDGHHHMRQLGISPWMRNVMSVWVRRANSYHSTQGVLTERTFKSYNITSNEALLANQAYTLGNKTHHSGDSPTDDPTGVWNLYAKGEPDGVVNAVPDYLDQLGEGSIDELLLAIIWRAVKLETTEVDRPWMVATREILAERAPAFRAIDLPGDADVVSIVDADRHRAMVAERLAWQWTRREFQPRKAPQFGETIEIVVREQIDPDHPFG